MLPADGNIIGQVVETSVAEAHNQPIYIIKQPWVPAAARSIQSRARAFPVVDKLALEIIEGCHKPKGTPKPFKTLTAVKTTNLRERL